MDRVNIMLGVVGDSAAGKTTLTEGIVNALGADQVTAICSDDYHSYNRKQRKERGVSALSPDGNYIDIMEQHFRLLREGQPILKPIYNHSTGDFDRVNGSGIREDPQQRFLCGNRGGLQKRTPCEIVKTDVIQDHRRHPTE